MAGRPISGITADTDLSLDFLTKEAKEALLSKKMDMIRQRNRVINERHELIEADRRKAEETGNAVKAMDSKTLPAEGIPSKPKGRGRGNNQGSNKDGGGGRGRDRPKSHGDTSSYEPIVDVSDFTVRIDNSRSGKGRGGQFHHEKEGPSHTPKNRRKPHHKEEGYNAGNARYNRRSDPNPPPDPSFNPLSDWRRSSGSDRKEGFERQDRSDRSDHKRHPRNYGGGSDLSKVKDNIKNMREKERERPGSNKPLEMVMTGRERKNHEHWKQERDRFDNERIQRQLTDGGGWRREWDQDKVVIEYEDSYSRTEPAKRPVGRIGSGRFDRGDSREDRPKAPTKDGKGGMSQQGQTSHNHHQHYNSQPQQNNMNSQHQQAPISPQHSTTMQTPPQQHLNDNNSNKSRPKGRGRGRGRGRGVVGQGGSSGPVGDKSPRPRTWSGGDDRFVECQKEMLVVKFDNTVGDDSVEVEYENGAPLSPTPSSKSSGSTPGRGPTGRTPNQNSNSSSSGSNRNKGGRQNNPKSDRASKAKVGSGRMSGHQLGSKQTAKHYPDQFVDADGDISIVNHHSYPEGGSKIRTYSSHSQSQGDSEEWEDCTQSSGAPEDDCNNPLLHVDCQLNPDAPEFLPTSPDFLKTPPGHVKVLNWAGRNSQSSPQSNPTQPSFTSPSSSPRQQSQPDEDSNLSSVSSPGSSASTRAKNRHEEIDMMPEPDEPLPPPFLLELNGAVKDKDEVNGADNDTVTNGNVDAEIDENGDEKFVDSVDDLITGVEKEIPNSKDKPSEQSKSDEDEKLLNSEVVPPVSDQDTNALHAEIDLKGNLDIEATPSSQSQECGDNNSEIISESKINEEEKSSSDLSTKKDVNDNDNSKVDDADDTVINPDMITPVDDQDNVSASKQTDLESPDKDKDSQPTAENSTES